LTENQRDSASSEGPLEGLVQGAQPKRSEAIYEIKIFFQQQHFSSSSNSVNSVNSV